MVRLEVATEKDLPLMMAWRSNPIAYEGFYQQNAPLEWEHHVNWFRSRNQDWRTFIGFYNERPVGVVTIGQLDHHSPEIGYYVGEVSLWGKGIGTEMVRQAIMWIKEYAVEYPHITGIHTTILRKNERSKRLLEKLSFRYMAEGRKGEIWLQRKL